MWQAQFVEEYKHVEPKYSGVVGIVPACRAQQPPPLGLACVHIVAFVLELAQAMQSLFSFSLCDWKRKAIAFDFFCAQALCLCVYRHSLEWVGMILLPPHW